MSHRFRYRLVRYLSPRQCDRALGRLLPWSAVLCALLFLAGCYDGLLMAPPDYQQGDAYRIMFIHVPAAVCSLMVYVVMTGFVVLHWVWKIKIADALARVCAPIGAVFTLITLVSGAIWGRPTWGTYWIWDARLTSEFILLIIYFGIILLRSAIRVPELSARAAAVVTCLGLINIPIVHYSVDWWQTLHQGASLLKWGAPSIAGAMLRPLLIMIVAFIFYF